ncbi:16S rRNA methyltransferase [Candidatus Bathyarchaeota archaeon]|nr:16S rRNA methyltransferase [Candidatus Bathyarchaeota archaeon]
MLTLIIAEASLETIPKELLRNRDVLRHARLRGISPRFMLLDRSYHHHAMLKLQDGERRGRPDIVHFALLETLGTPLNLEGLLKIRVHTLQNFVIEVSPEVRLPKNYLRFKGLIEQLFRYGKVPPEPGGKPLMILKRQSLRELMEEMKPSLTVGLTTEGAPITLTELACRLKEEKEPAVLVGGFPRGHFSDGTKGMLQALYRIDPASLETSVVVSRLIYAFEKAIGIEDKRFKAMLS